MISWLVIWIKVADAMARPKMNTTAIKDTPQRFLFAPCSVEEARTGCSSSRAPAIAVGNASSLQNRPREFVHTFFEKVIHNPG